MSDESISHTSREPRFSCIRARCPDAAGAERVLAEADAAGALGAEQRDEADGITLLLYARPETERAVAAAAAAVLGSAAVEPTRAVDPVDWASSWKAGLRPIEISPRLRLRASFETSAPRPGQRDLVIDPGQAFGTGGHESTRLACEWIDALRDEQRADDCFLDAGTGSGVLALAALALGAGRALGFDLDPLAAPAARENARLNGFAARFQAFTGPIEALAEERRFAGVAANLLRRELEPLLPSLATRLRPGGWLVISGLLEEECRAVRSQAAGCGLHDAGARRLSDASGVVWTGLLMRRSS